MLCANGSNDGQPWTQGCRDVRIVEPNFYRDSLDDFRVIAGGIVGREQRELRTAGRRDLDDFPVEDLAGVFIDPDFGRIADFHIRELRLAVVGLHPFHIADKSDHLRSGRYQLPRPYLSLAHTPIRGSSDLRVSKIHFGYGERCFFRVHVGDQLELL